MRALEIVGATAFTAALYWSCSGLQRRFRISLLHPLLLSVVAGGTLFALLPPSWLDAYVRGSKPLLWLLGPPPRLWPSPSTDSGPSWPSIRGPRCSPPSPGA